MHTIPHPRATRSTAALLALALTLGACASVPGLGFGASRLREKADVAIEARDYETAYDHLAELHRRYPKSSENEEAFLLAAALLQRLYAQNRYAKPATRWTTSEPEFLFGWLATQAADDYPDAAVRQLFLGMNYGFFRRFEAYAKDVPALAQWQIEAEEDNGIIEIVRSGAAAEADAGSGE